MSRSNVLIRSRVERASQGYDNFMATARMMEQEWPDDAAESYLLAARRSPSMKHSHDAAKRAYEVADSEVLMKEALEVRVEAARILFFADDSLDAALMLYDASATAMAHDAGVAGPLYEKMALASRRLCESGMSRQAMRSNSWSEETRMWARVWYKTAHESLKERESGEAHVQVSLAARAMYVMTRNRRLLIERYEHLVKAVDKMEPNNGIGLLHMAAKTASKLSCLGNDVYWHKKRDACYMMISELRKVRRR